MSRTLYEEIAEEFGEAPAASPETIAAVEGRGSPSQPLDADAVYDEDDDLVPLGEAVEALQGQRAAAATAAAHNLLRLDRAQPNAADAERALLGALLLSADVIEAVTAEGLQPGHFFRPAHGLVYAAMLDLHRRGEPVDTLTVVDELQRTGKLAEAGGAALVSGLEASLPIAAHAESYARMIREKAIYRDVIRLSTQAVQAAFAQSTSPAALVDDLRGSLGRIEDTGNSGIADNRTLIERVRARMPALGGVREVVGTGLPSLDEYMHGGFEPGDLVIVAARPGMGKACRIDTPVLTPTGWRAIGDLVVGDLVVGRNGKPTKVLGVYDQGVVDLFRVTMSDGGWVDVCGEHLWKTQTLHERLVTGEPGAVRRTADIDVRDMHIIPRFAHDDRRGPRLVTSIEPIGRGEARCIRVDAEDHLFVVRDDIVTHNTQYVLDIADHLTIRRRKRVVYFSLEMGGDQLLQRMAGARANVDTRRTTIDHEERQRLEDALEELTHAPLRIDDRAGLTLGSILARARAEARHGDLGMVVVDYLQLIAMQRTHGMSTDALIGEVTRGLKTLARQLRVPVLALSQLNRGVESRPNKRPVMSDLRESGNIEQDADIITFLYREEYYERERTPKEKRGTAEVIFAKYRNGAAGGTVQLHFGGAGTPRFRSLVREDDHGQRPPDDPFA